MKQLFLLLTMPVLAGCLTARETEVAEWFIPSEARAAKTNAQTEFSVARLSQLVIRAPYDETAMAVLRTDGTLAFDPFNRFAAPPAQLLKGPVQDALSSCPRFGAVVGSSSSASSTHVVEVTITRLRLDCSTDDSRVAEVEASVLVLDHERTIVFCGVGIGRADAKDGRFGLAFSNALASALAVAMNGK